MSSHANESTLSFPHNYDPNFPELPELILDRSHVIGTILDVTSSGDVIFLEGDEGCGATTLLAQFCQSNAGQCFSLFIKPLSRFAYSAELLRMVLAEQFWFYVNGVPIDRESIDVTEFQNLLLKVRKKQKAATLYVIVDGLHQANKNDRKAIDEVFSEVLPLGFPGFKFLITGQAQFFESALNGARGKPCQVPRFSPEESRALLSGLNLTDNDIAAIQGLCNGVPGRLALVRRLVLSGIEPRLILDSEPSKYLEFIKLEFSALDTCSEVQSLMIALLAFSKHVISTAELVAMCPGANAVDIESLQEKCSFLSFQKFRDVVEFVSEPHRRFAERKLETLKNRSIEIQIEYLRENPDSTAALQFLPTYLQLLNKQQAIIDLLSPEHYTKLLEKTQSISQLKARAALGAKNAAELKKVTELFQFGLQRSIFDAIGSIRGTQAEVAALVALGEKQRALDLAATTVSNESRLLLLTEFARGVREKGDVLDHDLVSYIIELARTVDFSDFGADTGRLAENLLFVDPDLALAVAESSGKEGSRERDEALAKLNFASATSNVPDKESMSERARLRISNDGLQKVLRSLNALVADFGIGEIKEISSKMKFDRKIAFLRKLAVEGVLKSEALDVVDFALDEIVSESSYRPSVKDLIDLAAPLSISKDAARISSLVKRMDGQFSLIEEHAPSTDIVQFQLLLVHGLSASDRDSSLKRLKDVNDAILEVADLEVRVECLALFLGAGAKIEDAGWRQRSSAMLSDAHRRIREDITLLLTGSASHFEVTEGALRALARTDATGAIEIAAMLNNEHLRDEAYSLIANTLAENDWSEGAASSLKKAIESIVDPVSKDSALNELFESVAKRKSSSDWIDVLLWARGRMSDSRVSCKAALNLIDLCVVRGRVSDVAALDAELSGVIQLVDSPLDRIELLYSASAVLAKVNAEKAAEYYSAAKAVSDSTQLASESADELVRICLTLLLRVMRPLIGQSALTDQHMERFSRLVEMLPTELERSGFFGELAIRAWCEGKHDLCRKIVNERCRPNIDALDPADGNYPFFCRVVFTPLYLAHKASAYALLDGLSTAYKAEALRAVAFVVLRKIAPSEQWVGDDFDLKIGPEEASDVLELLDRAPTDSSFYSILQALVEAATSKGSRARLTAQQRIDMERKILEMIQRKLPDAKNIKHDGYAIVAKARARALLDGKVGDWSDLVNLAEVVPCVADRQYVYLELADSLPTRLADLRKRLLQQAYAEINQIPSIHDRQAALRHYIDVARKYDLPSAKVALREALQMTFLAGKNGSGHRRSLVDLAESIEPGFAEKIADVVDDDPARKVAKKEIQRAIEVQKFKRQICGNREKVESAALSRENLPAASWKNVGSLVAGKIVPKAPDHLVDFLNAAVTFDLHDAFPVLSWYLENAARRYVTQSDAEDKLAPLCEVLLLSTELGASVLGHARPTVGARLRVKEGVSDSGVVLGPRDRAVALDFLRDWLRVNGGSSIVLCDPYFAKADIEFLRLALSECPDSSIKILTSKKAMAKVSGEDMLGEWERLVEQDPPDTEIIVVNDVGDDRSPVHDRWLISGDSGLRLGTSFHALGSGRITEISVLSVEKAQEIAEAIQAFVRKQRIVNGKRVAYVSFTL